MDWAQILVIILSIFLAMFLLLGIVLVVMLIRLTRQIKAVTDSARTTAERIEHIVTGVSKLSSPMFLLQMLTKFIKKAKRHMRTKGGTDV